MQSFQYASVLNQCVVIEWMLNASENYLKWNPLWSAVAATTEADVICDVKTLKSAETFTDMLSHFTHRLGTVHWILQSLDPVLLTAVKGYVVKLLLLILEAWMALGVRS